MSLTQTYSAVDGYATNEGTRKYVDNATDNNKILRSHFRSFDGLHLSSIGMGTYLGEATSNDDELVENAVYESVKSSSINVIDTAINYRLMKSEKSIGRAIDRLVKDNIISRNQIFISTKNGYITNDGDYSSIGMMEYIQKMFIATGLIDPSDISSGYHVLNPNYIARCIDKSLMNMRLNTIDLVYIHNAYEGWHADIGKSEFYESIAKVFQTYEKYRSNNKIRYYGMATWTCFRVQKNSKEYLSLEEVVNIAQKVGGKEHGFRFIQLPYNLAYSEALLLENQNVGLEKNLTILEAAEKLNIKVFTSIPLFQSRLLRAKIPDYMGLDDQIAKLIQIIRSSPSVIAPLIGYKKPEHIEQNLKVANIPPLNEQEFKDAIKLLLKGNP